MSTSTLFEFWIEQRYIPTFTNLVVQSVYFNAHKFCLFISNVAISETVVDEDFIVKLIILVSLVTILSWIYPCISYFYIIRLKNSIESCIVPAYETQNYFYSKFSNFISRSIMSKIMTVLNSEIARKKRVLDEDEKVGGKGDKSTENIVSSKTSNTRLKGILVKDKKNSRRDELQYLEVEQEPNQKRESQTHIKNCSGLDLKPAFIIPVPNCRKIKFNKDLIEALKK